MTTGAIGASAVLEYWRSGSGMGHITPGGIKWPEGGHFAALLGGLLADERVVEIGCGPGRLASCLPADAYVGLDICPQALELARERHPRHDFRLVDWEREPPLPEGTAALFHTVLLHVPDEVLPELLAELGGFQRVIVGEILGRKWRRPGNPPVFNREIEEYQAAFAEAGFALRSSMILPYVRYKDTHLTLMDFRRTEGT